MDHSAEMSILGDTKKFSFAVDGACYSSGASHSGVKVCDCKAKAFTACPTVTQIPMLDGNGTVITKNT